MNFLFWISYAVSMIGCVVIFIQGLQNVTAHEGILWPNGKRSEDTTMLVAFVGLSMCPAVNTLLIVAFVLWYFTETKND